MSINELHDALYLRLGRLTQIVAQMDLHIGLAVSWLGQNNRLDISNLIDPAKTRFSMRLGMLKKLVEVTCDQRTPQKEAEFGLWFNRISSLPALTNHYLHAKWSFHGIADDEEPYVLYKVPNWNRLPDPPDNGAKLTFKAFDQQIEALEQLNQDFARMCDCSAEYVTPFKAAFSLHELASTARASNVSSTVLEQMSMSMPFHIRPATPAATSALN